MYSILHQLPFTEQELIETMTKYHIDEVVGSDTLMFLYQYYRYFKVYDIADMVRILGEESGFFISAFKDHYEIFIDPFSCRSAVHHFKNKNGDFIIPSLKHLIDSHSLV